MVRVGQAVAANRAPLIPAGDLYGRDWARTATAFWVVLLAQAVSLWKPDLYMTGRIGMQKNCDTAAGVCADGQKSVVSVSEISTLEEFLKRRLM